MGLKPFAQLVTPRQVNRPELPQELVQFYSTNEAIEFEGLEYGSLYLHPLRDVKRVGWAGLDLIGDCPERWESLDCFLIGSGCHFEKIVYVVSAPCCQPGAVLALGGQLDWGLVGTGSSGSDLAWGLVLGASLYEWLRHLEEYGWWEYAIGFDIPQLPVERQRQLRAYYLALNPSIEWPEP